MLLCQGKARQGMLSVGGSIASLHACTCMYSYMYFVCRRPRPLTHYQGKVCSSPRHGFRVLGHSIYLFGHCYSVVGACHGAQSASDEARVCFIPAFSREPTMQP